MTPSHPRLRLVLLACAISMLMGVSTGCVHHHPVQPGHVHRAAPPPWVPAHGYRHHYDGVVLLFDTRIDCYTVVGQRDYYFDRDHYYRYHRGRWERGPRPAGPWVAVQVNVLPRGLHHVHADRHRHAQRPPEPRREPATARDTRKQSGWKDRLQVRREEPERLHARQSLEEREGPRDRRNQWADRRGERVRDASPVRAREPARAKAQREKQREAAPEPRRERARDEKGAGARRGRVAMQQARDEDRSQRAESGRVQERPDADRGQGRDVDRSQEKTRETKWGFRARSPR